MSYAQWSGIPTAHAQPWEAHLAGARALINMAGRSVNCRYTARNRKQMMDSRIFSTRALGQALARCQTPPAIWINSSTATAPRIQGAYDVRRVCVRNCVTRQVSSIGRARSNGSDSP